MQGLTTWAEPNKFRKTNKSYERHIPRGPILSQKLPTGQTCALQLPKWGTLYKTSAKMYYNIMYLVYIFFLIQLYIHEKFTTSTGEVNAKCLTTCLALRKKTQPIKTTNLLFILHFLNNFYCSYPLYKTFVCIKWETFIFVLLGFVLSIHVRPKAMVYHSLPGY